MAIVFDRGRLGGAGNSADCGCADAVGGGACCGEIGDLAAAPGVRGQALRQLGRAHQAGGVRKHLGRARRAAAGGLGDVDMSSFVVSEATIDAESDAFDGRLNAWLLDYSTAAARLPASYVQQVDDFVVRWRKIRAAFYFFQTSRLHDIVNAEGEFNKFRDQYLRYGQTTAIAPATVTAGGETVRSDQIPDSASWFSQVKTIAIWGGVIVGGAAALKISSDLGLFKKIGHMIGPTPSP